MTLTFGKPQLARIRPPERSFLQALNEPKPRSIPVKHLPSRPTPIAEHKKRSLMRILTEAPAHQCMEPIKALAQITGFHRKEYLETAAEAQHPARPTVISPIHSATAPSCRADSTRATPASSTINTQSEAPHGTASTNCTASFLVAAHLDPCLIFNQSSNVAGSAPRSAENLSLGKGSVLDIVYSLPNFLRRYKRWFR
jgi:hypothetical protein